MKLLRNRTYFDFLNLQRCLGSKNLPVRQAASIKNKRRVRVPDRIMIEHRDPHIESRNEAGHWEKGSIENRIGMIRRYVPKKTDWSLITQKQLDKVVKKINTRPMKCLGFKTPEEVFVALRH